MTVSTKNCKIRLSNGNWTTDVPAIFWYDENGVKKTITKVYYAKDNTKSGLKLTWQKSDSPSVTWYNLKLSSGDNPYVEITPTTNITINNFTFYSTNNSTSDTGLRQILKYDSSSSASSSGKYLCVANNSENGFSETVSSTDYTTSTGDKIYKHTITLTTPYTLEAGNTYLISCGIKSYSDNSLCYNDNTTHTGKTINTWAILNRNVGSYCQDWGTVTNIEPIEFEYNT